jgi:hypothetical protein
MSIIKGHIKHIESVKKKGWALPLILQLKVNVALLAVEFMEDSNRKERAEIRNELNALRNL